MLSQFTPDHPGQRTLAECGLPASVYPLGRLDRDSEGLLLLSDEAGLNSRLLDPTAGHPRTYLVQVEGVVTDRALAELGSGVLVQGKKTLPAYARCIDPSLPPRDPPVRFRKAIPTSWLEITLTEGRNRQVRRMTAAVGYPTLRLIRVQVGGYQLPNDLAPGRWRQLGTMERQLVFQKESPEAAPGKHPKFMTPSHLRR
ncbi:MAG: pseudouridine synthase [Terrimicrobiaceae bacterium]